MKTKKKKRTGTRCLLEMSLGHAKYNKIPRQLMSCSNKTRYMVPQQQTLCPNEFTALRDRFCMVCRWYDTAKIINLFDQEQGLIPRMVSSNKNLNENESERIDSIQIGRYIVFFFNQNESFLRNVMGWPAANRLSVRM